MDIKPNPSPNHKPPLAVLADSKGWYIEFIERNGCTWSISLVNRDKKHAYLVNAKEYDACENASRHLLEVWEQ